MGYLHYKKNKNHFHLRLNKTNLVVYFLDLKILCTNVYGSGSGFNTETSYAPGRASPLRGGKASGVLIYHLAEPPEKLKEEKGMACCRLTNCEH